MLSLYFDSLVDASAAENVGRVLAQRCLEFGITNVFYEEEEGDLTSEKVNAVVPSVLCVSNWILWFPLSLYWSLTMKLEIFLAFGIKQQDLV